MLFIFITYRLQESLNDASMEENSVYSDNTNNIPMDLDETIPYEANVADISDKTKKLNLNQDSENVGGAQGKNSLLFEKNSLINSQQLIKPNELLIDEVGSIENSVLENEKSEIVKDISINSMNVSLEHQNTEIFSPQNVNNVTNRIEHEKNIYRKGRPTIYFGDDIDIDKDKTFHAVSSHLYQSKNVEKIENYIPEKSIQNLDKTIYFQEDIDESTIYNDGTEISQGTTENDRQCLNTKNRNTVYIYEPIADITLPMNNNDIKNMGISPTETEITCNVNIQDTENKKTDNLLENNKLSQTVNNYGPTNKSNEISTVVEDMNGLKLSNNSTKNQNIENGPKRRETTYKKLSMDLSISFSDDKENIESDVKNKCEVIVLKENTNNSKQEADFNDLAIEKELNGTKGEVESIHNYETPQKDSDNQKRLKDLYRQTPSQSVMEFLEIEHYTAHMEETKCNVTSFTAPNNGMKRLSVNLTPLMQPEKKILNISSYKSCNMEETLMENKSLISDDKKEVSTPLEAYINETALSNTIEHNQIEDLDGKKSIYISEMTLLESNLNENTQQSSDYHKDSYTDSSYGDQVINLDSTSSSMEDDDNKDKQCQDSLIEQKEDFNDMNQSNLIKSMQMPRRYTVNDQTLQHPLKFPENLDLDEEIEKMNIPFNSGFKSFICGNLPENKYEELDLSGTEKIWKRIKERLPAKSIDTTKMCRTCRCCRKTLENELSIVDGKIDLPVVPSMAEMVGLEHLRKLPKKPSLRDVDGLWRSLELKGLDRLSLNSGDDTLRNSLSVTDSDSNGNRSDLFIKNYCENIQR